MCGAVKIRTVFVDAGAAPDLPQTSCVFTVSPLLRELFVAAMRVPLDYAPATSDERLMLVLLDQLREVDVLPLHLPMPRDARLARICKDAGEPPRRCLHRRAVGAPAEADVEDHPSPVRRRKPA